MRSATDDADEILQSVRSVGRGSLRFLGGASGLRGSRTEFV